MDAPTGYGISGGVRRTVDAEGEGARSVEHELWKQKLREKDVERYGLWDQGESWEGLWVLEQ